MNIAQLFFQSLIGISAVFFICSRKNIRLPLVCTKIYRYGKCNVPIENSLLSQFEVPKKWFRHFYIFSAPTATILVILMILRYNFDKSVPDFLNSILDLEFGRERKALVSPESALLATLLFSAHCWKRCYESHYISVFSDGKMNVSAYALAFVHYAGTISCFIGESEGFVIGSNSVIRWNRITKLQYACSIGFLLAAYEQFKTNEILGNLRKDKSGNVVTKSYKIPSGRLFEYISAPLQLTEIIIYGMLSIILWSSSTYHCVFLWVVMNQIETATSSHEWYVKSLQDYPKQRKIIIPYLY